MGASRSLQVVPTLVLLTVRVLANAQTGEVVLSGFIDSQDQEHIATEAASKVPGVKSVSSKIVQRPQL